MLGLMDCNNFFVSCERLFRPDLAKKPVIVLSSNDGCVVSRSQEVKDLGIPMGIPFFQIRKDIEKHAITVFSSNFTLYRDISSRVMTALRDEFDRIEVYSIDEAFFNNESLSQVDNLVRIRAKIIQKTGIPVSFGVAPTKTLAKLANDRAKKGSGVFSIDKTFIEEYGSTIPVGMVWGIGRETAEKLNRGGVYTVADFLRCGLSYARSHHGVVGERLFHELSGESTSYGVDDKTIPASITSSRSFGKKVDDPDHIRSALAYHTTLVAEKLRERGHMARTIHIYCVSDEVGIGRRSGQKWSVTLDTYTNGTHEILEKVLALFEDVYVPHAHYKKAGILVSDIVPEIYVSQTIFENAEKVGRRVLDGVTDAINKRYGRDTIRPAVIQGEHEWRERRNMKSPEYTTSWHDIAPVKAI